jgi:hypothetical protein
MLVSMLMCILIVIERIVLTLMAICFVTLLVITFSLMLVQSLPPGLWILPGCIIFLVADLSISV